MIKLLWTVFFNFFERYQEYNSFLISFFNLSELFSVFNCAKIIGNLLSIWSGVSIFSPRLFLFLLCSANSSLSKSEISVVYNYSSSSSSSASSSVSSSVLSSVLLSALWFVLGLTKIYFNCLKTYTIFVCVFVILDLAIDFWYHL